MSNISPPKNGAIRIFFLYRLLFPAVWIYTFTMKKKLLLHCCCAPCATSVIPRLREEYDVTAFFCNPNILPEAEYVRRRSELLRLLGVYDVPFLETEYRAEDFLTATEGMRDLPEGGKRCEICFALRLDATARAAKENGFDCFTTTLSVSPHKNADVINAVGTRAGETHSVDFICANFKKKDGYLQSVRLSKQFNLYRQNYCGCTPPKS